MNPLEARNLALKLLAQHGLHEWRFEFDHARRRFGCCKYRTKIISLSRPLTLLNDVAQVTDTILHEIAHALTPGDGHGAKWRAACVRVGARPQRCYTENEVAAPPRRPAAYRYGCPPCAWWVERRRLVANRYVCGKCGGKLIYEQKATGRAFRVEAGARRTHLIEVAAGRANSASG